MTRFQRWFLYWSSAVAFVSGVAYFWMKHFLEPAEPWAVINHPLQPWALKAHILAAPLMLFAVGMITTQHIWRSLRSKLPTGRRTGVAAVLSFGPLVLTGYLIQTATATLVADLLGWTHLALGIACTAAIGLHRLFVRGRRRRRPSSLPILILPKAVPSEASPEGLIGSRAIAPRTPTHSEVS
ncbi:MAG: hypothetical protein O2992_11775 [Gemmatimonadetes bacterium]|nr:hypothetical protein [Gemmatimonadota bacterium]